MSSKKKTTAKKDDSKPTLVPKLRFPLFRDNWSESLLGSVVKEYRQNSSVQDEYEVLTSARRGLMRQVDYYGEGRITERDNVGFNVIPADYITYRSRTDDGRFYFNHNDLGITGVISVYYPVFSSVIGSNAFLASLLNHFSILIGSHSVGTSQRVLPISKLLRVTLPIPSPVEQQKIAECLSSVDELMAAQGRKVDALKTHKKGLMQQLFPREGETQPRLRFPEFQNAGEWEPVRLDAISRVIRGSSPRPQGDPRFFGGPVPRLMVQDVTRDGKWVTPRIDSLTEEGATMSRPCPAGTLTIVCSGVVGIVSFLAVDACIHDGFLALVDIDELRADKDFLFHTLSTLRNEFERGATHGGVFTNLTTQGIKEFVINFPGIPEQQRIASCLSSLDALITAETQKLEALKTHKRGLMQQLFPSPGESSQ
jgi:type I restriction enzyme S subunit